MGFLIKLIDTILFFYFILHEFGGFIFNVHVCLPHLIPFFPTSLTELMNWYVRELGEYLAMEKPHFFVGILWIELHVPLPLSFACVYGIATRKSSFPTTCLIYGVSFSTLMGTLVVELLGSGRASKKMWMVYLFALCFGVLTALRGLVPHSGKANGVGKSPMLNRKKTA